MRTGRILLELVTENSRFIFYFFLDLFSFGGVLHPNSGGCQLFFDSFKHERQLTSYFVSIGDLQATYHVCCQWHLNLPGLHKASNDDSPASI